LKLLSLIKTEHKYFQEFACVMLRANKDVVQIILQTVHLASKIKLQSFVAGANKGLFGAEGATIQAAPVSLSHHLRGRRS
jgi:hypothetical protein